MQKKILWTSLVLASAIIMTGCGSNDKTDANSVVGARNIVLSLDTYPVAVMDTERGAYIARYAVHAVDGRGNPQSRLPIEVAIVNKDKEDLTGYNGAIHKTEPVTFTEANTNFAAKGIKPGDTLIIVPVTNGTEELSYVGNWKISQVSDKLTLGLDKVYNLAEAGLLHYVVGNEKGTDGTLAHVQRPDDSNTSRKVPETEKGFSYFDIMFDRKLVASGRCVWVGVHLSGNRTGTAKCVYPVAPQKPSDDSNSGDNNTSSGDNNTSSGDNNSSSCTGGSSCSASDNNNSSCSSGKCPDKKP